METFQPRRHILQWGMLLILYCGVPLWLGQSDMSIDTRCTPLSSTVVHICDNISSCHYIDRLLGIHAVTIQDNGYVRLVQNWEKPYINVYNTFWTYWMWSDIWESIFIICYGIVMGADTALWSSASWSQGFNTNITINSNLLDYKRRFKNSSRSLYLKAFIAWSMKHKSTFRVD